MKKNNILIIFTSLIILVIFTFCKTNPPSNVKIIEEHDPVVKNLEEKDSMRIIQKNTEERVTRKKP